MKTKGGVKVNGVIKQQGTGCDICGALLVATITIGGSEFEATHDIECDTCKKPLLLCDDCWNDEDDCNECYERREKEQWCPLCDLVCMNMTEEEKKRHMQAHRAEKVGR
jgi:hypothetical protein